MAVKMAVEIEAKLKVDSLEKIADSLKTLGAEFIETQLQTDCYFDNDARDMVAKDQCLRIRTQQTDNAIKTFVTYKGRKQKDDFKKRTEIEIPVPTNAKPQALLEALGYKQALIVKKKRAVWKLHDCLIALDEVAGLGNFVEIEGPDDNNIDIVRKKMNLNHMAHIDKSYAGLITGRTK